MLKQGGCLIVTTPQRGHVPSPSAGDVDAAAAIKSNMDLTADPCNDFYKYACGGWMKKHVIPDDT